MPRRRAAQSFSFSIACSIAAATLRSTLILA
jgi:hypothetical protein